MRVLITAGNTAAPIDRVRVITNVFRGRTGARIADAFAAAGHTVRLLTSAPETMPDPVERIEVVRYSTFDELAAAMAVELKNTDALIHSAAVSDYLCAGVFAPGADTVFADGAWRGGEGRPPEMIDVAAGKVKSDAPELWLRLARAPKLIDKVRRDWGFRGVVVKFKLEVGMSDERLLEIAEQSRRASDADLMVANTLEGADEWAYVGPFEASVGGATDRWRRVSRDRLGAELVKAVQSRSSARPGAGPDSA